MKSWLSWWYQICVAVVIFTNHYPTPACVWWELRQLHPHHHHHHRLSQSPPRLHKVPHQTCPRARSLWRAGWTTETHGCIQDPEIKSWIRKLQVFFLSTTTNILRLVNGRHAGQKVIRSISNHYYTYKDSSIIQNLMKASPESKSK